MGGAGQLRDILRRFLVGSRCCPRIGGTWAIPWRLLASWGREAIDTTIPSAASPFVVSLPAGLVALGFSAAVGVFFGCPAGRRAEHGWRRCRWVITAGRGSIYAGGGIFAGG